MSPQFYKTYF